MDVPVRLSRIGAGHTLVIRGATSSFGQAALNMAANLSSSHRNDAKSEQGCRLVASFPRLNCKDRQEYKINQRVKES
jgi:NADPH:quinone reductase-like Zn-dependent oxidoreductase